MGRSALVCSGVSGDLGGSRGISGDNPSPHPLTHTHTLTLSHQPVTLHPQPSRFFTLSPQPSALSPSPFTLHPHPSPLTLSPSPSPFTLTLLKVGLSALVRSGISGRAKSLAQPAKSLELPPRLLSLARKTQGRKPGGLGVLGLKQRVSSRQLAAMVFPLMSQKNAILEAPDEEALLESPPNFLPL